MHQFLVARERCERKGQGANAPAAAGGPVYGPTNKPMPLAPLLVRNLDCITASIAQAPEWLCC